MFHRSRYSTAATRAEAGGHSRARRGRAAILLAALAVGLAIGGPGAGAATHGALPIRTTASRSLLVAPGSPIQHVVVILQENHSFDNLLGQLCVDNQTSHVRTACNGYTGPVTFADGKRAPGSHGPDIVPGVAHDRASQLLGLQNRWNQIPGCRPPTYNCVEYYAQHQIPNLAKYANTVSSASKGAITT